MRQSRVMSATEVTINIAVGWTTALCLQVVLFPLVGLEASPAQHAAVSCAFTGVSFLRMYLLRRVFAGLD